MDQSLFRVVLFLLENHVVLLEQKKLFFKFVKFNLVGQTASVDALHTHRLLFLEVGVPVEQLGTLHFRQTCL